MTIDVSLESIDNAMILARFLFLILKCKGEGKNKVEVHKTAITMKCDGCFVMFSAYQYLNS
ncbi:hypothetical protein BCU17_17705 [Vibrio splendidus]|uniref:Uncharacterized protein n=1 Tax=Vibrio splendidus TaxID=29497 RepID=A0A2N7FDA4_VIBSP|nr:hypothetical protein BCU17_17705 [Vibrio splendidus]